MHDLHGLPVRTTVLALAPVAVPPARYVYGEGLDGELLHHSVTARRVFEESADAALQRDVAELLPLITVMEPADGDRRALLRRVVARRAALLGARVGVKVDVSVGIRPRFLRICAAA